MSRYQILSLTRIKYTGCWLLSRGSGGMHPNHPQGGTPNRGQGKGKLHLFHKDPCTSHAFLTFFVDGQCQLGQLKSTLTTQQSLTSENLFLLLNYITLLLKQVPLLNFPRFISLKLLMNTHCFHLWVHSKARISPCFWNIHYLRFFMWLGQFEMMGWQNMRREEKGEYILCLYLWWFEH